MAALIKLQANSAGANKLQSDIFAKLKEIWDASLEEDAIAKYIVALLVRGHDKKKLQSSVKSVLPSEDTVVQLIDWLVKHIRLHKEEYQALDATQERQPVARPAPAAAPAAPVSTPQPQPASQQEQHPLLTDADLDDPQLYEPLSDDGEDFNTAEHDADQHQAASSAQQPPAQAPVDATAPAQAPASAAQPSPPDAAKAAPQPNAQPQPSGQQQQQPQDESTTQSAEPKPETEAKPRARIRSVVKGGVNWDDWQKDKPPEQPSEQDDSRFRAPLGAGLGLRQGLRSHDALHVPRIELGRRSRDLDGERFPPHHRDQYSDPHMREPDRFAQHQPHVADQYHDYPRHAPPVHGHERFGLAPGPRDPHRMHHSEHDLQSRRREPPTDHGPPHWQDHLGRRSSRSGLATRSRSRSRSPPKKSPRQLGAGAGRRPGGVAGAIFGKALSDAAGLAPRPSATLRSAPAPAHDEPQQRPRQPKHVTEPIEQLEQQRGASTSGQHRREHEQPAANGRAAPGMQRRMPVLQRLGGAQAQEPRIAVATEAAPKLSVFERLRGAGAGIKRASSSEVQGPDVSAKHLTTLAKVPRQAAPSSRSAAAPALAPIVQSARQPAAALQQRPSAVAALATAAATSAAANPAATANAATPAAAGSSRAPVRMSKAMLELKRKMAAAEAEMNQLKADRRTLVATNVNWAATDDVIQAHFSVAGPVKRVLLKYDPATLVPLGAAEVEFEDEAAVHLALVGLNNTSIMGRNVVLYHKPSAPAFYLGTPAAAIAPLNGLEAQGGVEAAKKRVWMRPDAVGDAVPESV